MSKAGYPYDNAPMERYFNTLKNECTNLYEFDSEDILYQTVEEFAYVDYNHVRPHSFNNYRTPYLAVKVPTKYCSLSIFRLFFYDGLSSLQQRSPSCKKCIRLYRIFDRSPFLCLCIFSDLTDRGSEFQIPNALECEEDNQIRKICPKGTSFDDYSQNDVNRIHRGRALEDYRLWLWQSSYCPESC